MSTPEISKSAAAKGLDILLDAATRSLPWNVRIELRTDAGPIEVPVRHPNLIEPDGVNVGFGGLVGFVLFFARLARRLLLGIDRSNRALERRIRACVLGAFDEQYRHLIEAMPMGEVMQIYGQIEEAQNAYFEFARSHARKLASHVAERMASERSADRADTGSGPIIRQHPNGTVERLQELRIGKPVPGEYTGGKRVVLGQSSKPEAKTD